MMTYIHFVINPVSGKGRHEITAAQIRSWFPRSEFRVEIDYTKNKYHAVEIAANIASAIPDLVIICGGDGTVNEVASHFVGSSVKIGIIPLGSGNGLAGNLGIPKNIEGALEIIKSGHTTKIDVGKVNEHFFFSNAGIGIDAMVIKKYEDGGKRTLFGYLRATMSAAFKFEPQKVILSVDGGETTDLNPFLLFISNSNEMGYSMSLTPKASLQDGWLDLVLIPQLTLLEKIKLGYLVLRNKITDFRKANHVLTKRLEIELPEAIFPHIQMDGEVRIIRTNILSVSVIEAGLEVLVPQK